MGSDQWMTVTGDRLAKSVSRQEKGWLMTASQTRLMSDPRDQILVIPLNEHSHYGFEFLRFPDR